MDRIRTLAIKKVESVTGEDVSSFEIHEVPSRSKGVRLFLFSYLDSRDKPPGSDIAVSVNVNSGEATMISD
jgi:hypothetical protein